VHGFTFRQAFRGPPPRLPGPPALCACGVVLAILPAPFPASPWGLSPCWRPRACPNPPTMLSPFGVYWRTSWPASPAVGNRMAPGLSLAPRPTTSLLSQRAGRRPAVGRRPFRIGLSGLQAAFASRLASRPILASCWSASRMLLPVRLTMACASFSESGMLSPFATSSNRATMALANP
jgi:hypothetical protein